MSLPSEYNLLKEYPNEYYFESGIWRGDSLRMAVDAGFKFVYGVEYFQEHIDFCMSRFRLKPYNIEEGVTGAVGMIDDLPCTMYLAPYDSAERLTAVLPPENAQATIFLDSHRQLFENEVLTPNPFPLLKELMQIAEHPIKTHTIIIDDILMMTHPDVTGWSLKQIQAAVLCINPEYKFRMVANPIINNLMVCYVG